MGRNYPAEMSHMPFLCSFYKYCYFEFMTDSSFSSVKGLSIGSRSLFLTLMEINLRQQHAF